MMVHADSRPLATTPARFEMLPSALAVIVGGEPGCRPALSNVPPLPGGAPALDEREPDVPGGRHRPRSRPRGTRIALASPARRRYR